MHDLKTVEDDLKEMITVNSTDGNWNYSPYMHGMTNGIIFALSVITDKEPVYLDAPDTWVEDTINFDKLPKSEDD